MVDWIEKQQIKRYDDMIAGLRAEHPPEQCNGICPADARLNNTDA